MFKFARTFYRLFRAAIFLLPLLIAFRGALYLRECLRTLAAPGTGVDFKYQARKGAVLHITAESYSFLWNSGTLHVVRPRLQDNKGTMLASADSARIAGIRVSGNEPIEGIVRNLKANLVRLPNGKFALEDYLPQKNPQTQNRAYNVKIETAGIDYVDLSGKAPYRQHVATPQLVVQGLGDTWVASGNLHFAGMGDAHAAIQRYADVGLLINLNSKRLSLGPAVEHFRTTPEGRGVEALKLVSARELVAEGPVRIFVPENEPFALSASLNAEARQVLYANKDRYDSATFQGLVTSSGVRGKLAVERRGTTAKFDGSVVWTAKPVMAGVLEADLGSPSDIPLSLQASLPRNIRFNRVQGKGWFSYGPTGFRFDGPVSARQLSLGGQRFQGLTGVARANGNVLRFDGARARWRGAPLSGEVAYFPASGRLSGAARSSEVDLSEMGRVAGISGVKGRGVVQAVFGGTASDPVASIRTSGNALYKLPGSENAFRGTFLASGRYTSAGLGLGSLVLDTKTGRLVAEGTATPGGRMALNVAATNVSLKGLLPDLGGFGSFSGHLTGSMSNPVLTGRAQVLDFQVANQTIPFVVANVKATRNHVQAESVHAAKGSAQASGSLAFMPRTGAISGRLTAKNLPLSDINEQISGVADASSVTITGSLKHPRVDADLSTRGLVVANRPIGLANTHVSLNGKEFSAPNITAELAGGTVVGSASGNLATKAVQLEVSGQNMSLPELAPELAPTANLEGRISGNAILSFAGADLRYAKGSGKVADVRLNRTLVGSGSWSANVSPTNFGGGLLIGTLDRYLDLRGLTVDRSKNTISADVTAYQIPLTDVETAVERYLPEPTNDLDRRIRRLEGVANAKATISGSLHEPTLNVTLFQLEDLALESRKLGTFSTQFLKAGPIWTVTQLGWDGPAGNLRSSGVVDERGETSIDGDLTNFDLGLLSLFSDKLTRIGGRAGLSFAVSGPTRSPIVKATLDASRTMVSTGSGPASQLEFGMVLDSIEVSQSSLAPDGRPNGGIVASGKLFYRGLEGNLSAQIPLIYPLTLPQGQPLQVGLDLPSHDLQSFAEYFPGIDAKRTKGTIGGHLGLGGVVGGVKLTGNVTAKADTFAMKRIQTTLNEANVSLTFADEALHFNLDGKSSEGGQIVSTFDSPVGDVSQRIQELSSRGVDALLDRNIAGTLAMKDFGVKWDGKEQGRLTAAANTQLTMSGPLRRPRIEGTASLSGVDTVLPAFDVATATAPTFLVDPEFNVKLALENTARINTSLAKLRMVGDGSLTGSLSEPSLSSNLTVLGGTIGLPNATVRIEPGGTVQLRYRTGPGGDTLASLNVDLTGNAGLTASLYGDLPQHFDISLRVRGDLLQENQALITAESDPPGLSQQRILALLGQQDLIAALAGSVSKLQASRELRNALAGYAVPALLSPVTTAFAKGLGLEYLDIAYDPFTQVSLSFAKELGRNLTVQGRRQLSTPTPGFKPQYDLRLVYRLPFGGKSLRRTSVSFGADQDRPWKVSVEYGFRF